MNRIDVSELQGYAARLPGEADQIVSDLAAAVAGATSTAIREARLASPVYLGELDNSIVSSGQEIREVPGTIRIRDSVFTPVAHGPVVEHGRRPGARRPPTGPIRRWVALKVQRGGFDVSWTGKTGEAAIDAAAYLIAGAIGSRGQAALRIFERAAEMAERELGADVDGLTDKWARRLEGA